MIEEIAMATVTPIVLLISRDPEVKQVSSVLQADGITCRGAASMRELQRALTGAKGRAVAVLDGELAADPNFPLPEVLERVCALPLLMLTPADAEASTVAAPQRTSVDEYARKPLLTSAVASRVKALILAGGLARATRNRLADIRSG